jgi:hypothetical protein
VRRLGDRAREGDMIGAGVTRIFEVGEHGIVVFGEQVPRRQLWKFAAAVRLVE